MTINGTIIKELEHTYRRTFPNDIKQYLLMKYAEEPFPYEFSEQDLYTNIRQDIRDYDAGELDIKLKSPLERWQEEREYLQNLYIKKCCEAHDLEEYITVLEHMLSDHGLECSRMVKRRIEYEIGELPLN
jgi:intein/homing endonuclease